MFNYNDIGKKIKALAKIIATIGIICSVFFGFCLLVVGIAGEDVGAVFGGILLALLGALFSWIGSFVLYGFGELIDKTAEIAENTRQNKPQNQPPYNQPPQNQPPTNP